MEFLVIILAVVSICFGIHIIKIHRQIQEVNDQLTRRILDQSKQMITMNLSYTDLMELVANLNRCLKEQERLLIKQVHSEREFKQLIANMSHDLRTPLTAIQGYLQLVERGKLSVDERKDLAVARKYTDQLGGLIGHFYEYTYLMNAKPELHIEELNITNLVIECIAGAVTMLESNGIRIEVIENQPVFAKVDREMMIRIIQNLLRNCASHAAGNVTVRIEQEDKVKIQFANPIHEEKEIDVLHIFDRFYTGDMSRHNSNSTGLGLSIVKLLVESMGGVVSATLVDQYLEICIIL